MLAPSRPLSSSRDLLLRASLRFPRQTARREAGITLATLRDVAETSNRFVHDPIVMWRMQRAGGLNLHAVIGPRADGAVVVWYINGRPLGFRDFGDWTSAVRWSERLQAQNWAVGWRQEPE